MMNSKQFDTQRYERFLSTFGIKVLRNLVKNVVERNESNKIHVRGRCNYGQNKRILNFGDSYISPSTTTREQNEHVHESHYNILDNKSGATDLQDPKTPVLTSQGLLKIAFEDEGKENQSKALKNAAGTVVSRMDEFSKDIYNVNNVEGHNSHIEWDDIFDTQLLNDLNVLDTADSKINTKKEITGESSIQFCTKNESNLGSSKIISKTTNYLNTTETSNSNCATNTLNSDLLYSDHKEANIVENLVIKKGKTKRKNANKITNVIPKKVKTPPADLPKNTFRKQKYTKAVKTWLSNVEPENFENDTELQRGGEISEEITSIPESINSEVKKNKNKTVQAQLTNKGGIMKFGKPKQNELSGTPAVMDPTSKNTVSTASITLKEKKSKPKFIAPVKSQIPVKNISYDIIILDDTSCEEHQTKLSALSDQEISMILIFSNGFCQLNSHYTEDKCEVDGVMFEVNDIIYSWKHVHKSLRVTMENLIHNNTIVCYDGKTLLKYFAAHCEISVISTKVKVLDMQIGGNLIDPNNPPDNFTNLQKLVSYVPEYTVATECARQKSAWYLAVLRECFASLRAVLGDHQLWNVFVEIEMPVVPILAEMEHYGVCVDTELLKEMESILERRMRATERACHAAAGRAFPLRSAPQLRAILYDELQLDQKGNVAVRETLCKGDKSTSETMLRNLMHLHALPRLVLEYRRLHKAHATFVAGIANQVKDGVIKPTWEQTAAVTGRIACNNPNLQAIPKAPFSLLLFPNETKEEELLQEPNATLRFRSAYVARSGGALLAADFRQIECRVFAGAAADTALLAALAAPDLFTVLAARWLGKPEAAVGAEERERTKRVVYALAYGAGARRLADILGQGYDHALATLASFNSKFPMLRSFGRGVVARCVRAGGRLATLCGRARAFPHICSPDPALRAQAERQAVNFIVQGSAADLCKRAMAAAARRLAAARARPLLQLHDELVWEVHADDLPFAAGEIKSAMEGVGASCGVAVPLPVAVSAGPHWGAMEDYPPPTAP